MRKKADKPAFCTFCHRSVELTFHHLIPRKVHRRTYFRKYVEREKLNQGIWVCRLCHRGIHKRFDEMELAKHFNTTELLLADAALQRHFESAAKQKS
tara:strand:+ start:435 stop:725 length:291 start_codon:yes stop_codon:yes gene_type:complete